MKRLMVGMGIMVVVPGCGGDTGEQAEEQVPEMTAIASVMITEPADGATVDAGPVVFVMETEGLEIMPAGTMDAGTGHHHLIVDGDVDWALPIPNDPGVHYHMGLAQTEFTIEDLTPGEHRVIAVVADGVHIPLDPPVADTITVVVR